MNDFTVGGAFSKGFGFFSSAAANHAVALIGIGLLVPFALQLFVIGGAGGAENAVLFQQAAMGGQLFALGLALLLVMAAGYVLQLASYFASWRLGLVPGESLGAALGFGFLAGLVVFLIFVAAIALVVFLGVQGVTSGSGGAAALTLILAIPVVFLFSAFYTAIMSAISVGMVFLLLIVAAMGSSAARANPALGGLSSGIGVLILLVLLALFFWLTARFSCTATAMARRRSLNPFAGLAESWRLTAPAQWRIMLYLLLVGAMLCVVFILLALVVGVGAATTFRGGGIPQQGSQQAGLVAMVFGLIFAIPVAYLAVLVPGGIYRELSRSRPEEEVFA